MTPVPVTARETHKLHPLAVKTFIASFVGELLSNQSLSGTPVVTPSPGTLTIENEAINEETFTDPIGKVTPAEKGVLFQASGAVHGTTYTVTVSCDTSDGDTVVLVCTIVGDDGRDG